MRALALVLLLSALAVAQDAPAPKGHARKARLAERDRWSEQAREFERAKRLPDALAALDKALSIELEVFGAVDEQIAGTLMWQARLHRQSDDFAHARKLLERAHSILDRLFGKSDWRTGDARRALADLGHRARLSPKERERLNKARTLSVRSVRLYRAGRYGDAIRIGKDVLEIFRAVIGESDPAYAAALGNLGLLYVYTGSYSEAETLLRQALEIEKKALGEAHPRYATSLHNLAMLYSNTGEYAKAEPLYLQALETNRKVREQAHEGIAASLNNLASLYRKMGEFAKAEARYREAQLVLRQVLGEAHPYYAIWLGNLGSLYMSMGDYAKAEPLCRRALKLMKKALGEAHPEYAGSLCLLARIYRSMGDYARAEPLFRQALEMRKRSLGERHPVYATDLGDLASLYALMGDNARAEALYVRARDIKKNALGEAHPAYAGCLNNLAMLYERAGEHAKAKTLYQESLEISGKALGTTHPDYAAGLNSLALLYEAMGEQAKAEQLLLQALEIEKKTLGEEHPHYATSLDALSVVYENAGEYSKAKPILEQAVAIHRRHLDNSFAVLSERQQFHMSRLFRGSFDAYVSLSAVTGGGNAAEVYTHLLAWKGAIFAQQYQARLMASDADASALFSEIASTSRRLATRCLATPGPRKQQARLRQIKELSLRKEEQERELSLRSAAYRRVQETQRITPSGLQELLPDGVVFIDLLEYVREKRPDPDERRVAAFVLPAKGAVRQVDLGPVAPIAKRIAEWRQGLVGGDNAQAAKELRRLVWEPIAKHLASAKVVLVSPDGVLTRLPFAALPGRAPGSFLVEEVAIAVIPVPQLLPSILGRERSGENSLLLVGDVDYDTTQAAVVTLGRSAARGPGGALPHFAPLASTRGEILAIRDSFEQRYENGAVKVLRRAKATESAFREQAGRHSWLHIATHGFFAPASVKSAQKGEVGYHPGLLSGLALAGANLKPDPERDDGILTALEVAALNLSGVEVAVLSACETGLGEVAGGEGVLGLQRAFQVAGVRTTVTSLWRVPDEATRLLMERFYENVWTKKLGKLQALREAQLWMLTEGSARGMKVKGEAATKSTRLPPYYWAAFVLSGDWR